MNKKYIVDIIFQAGVLLIAYSLFIECSSFFAESTSGLPSISLGGCDENYFGFWGIILISIALNVIFRKYYKK